MRSETPQCGDRDRLRRVRVGRLRLRRDGRYAPARRPESAELFPAGHGYETLRRSEPGRRPRGRLRGRSGRRSLVPSRGGRAARARGSVLRRLRARRHDGLRLSRGGVRGYRRRRSRLVLVRVHAGQVDRRLRGGEFGRAVERRERLPVRQTGERGRFVLRRGGGGRQGVLRARTARLRLP